VFLGLLGLPFVGCRPAPAPPWFREALGRLAAERRLGLLVRLPEDKEARHAWGHALVELLNSPDPGLRELLAETQLLCLETSSARALIGGARPDDDLILIDAQGYALDGVRLGPPGEGFPALFLSAGRALAHGPGDVRLRERARAATGGDDDPRALPRLVAEGKRAAIERQIRAADPAKPGPRLPYGIVVGPAAACGDACEEGDRVPFDCGLARVTPGARDFLKFIAR